MINKSRRIMVLVYFPINFLLSVIIMFNIYTQIIQPYKLTFLEIIFIILNFVFAGYIEIYMNKELKTKNKIIKELQKSLISQEEFIVNISHELKTPLNVIFSAVQLLKMYCSNGSLDEKRLTISKYLDSMK